MKNGVLNPKMQANVVTFDVPGQPVPQPRARVSTRGGFARAYVPAKHPVHAYRNAILLAAMAKGLTNREEEVHVFCRFTFERPPSHWNKSGLKKDAPKFPKPDCDNIGKAVLDALTSIAWVDDSQVTSLCLVKCYGERATTEVAIEYVS